MNRLTEFTVSKQVIVPKGQYDNIKAMQSLTFEVPEGEEPDYDKAWAELNLELLKEVDSIEAEVEKTAPKVEPSSTTYKPPVQENECPLHKGQYLEWSAYPSKKTGKKYKFHKLADGTYCFGN